MKFIIKGRLGNKHINIRLNAQNKSIANQYTLALHLSAISIKRDFSPFSPRIKSSILSQDLMLLSIMLESALPLKDALNSLSLTTSSAPLKQMYSNILLALKSGLSLEETLNAFAQELTPMGISLLSSGAHAGKLPQALNVLSSYFQALSDNKASFLKALFYPAFVILSVCVTFIIIAYFVIPQFSALFDSFEQALPLSTQALISTSSFIREYGIYLLALIFSLVLILWHAFAAKNAIYEYLFDLALKVPMLGKIILYKDLWAYFLSFCYLYEARLDFSTILSLSYQSLQIPRLKREIKQASNLIDNGQNLDVAFLRCSLIDKNVKSFLATAQKSGELKQMLELATRYYQGLYKQLISRILGFIEPFSTILIALLVGWLAFGIFLPIWELGSVGI